MTEQYSNTAILKKFTDFLESGSYRKTPERFTILEKILLLPHTFTIVQLNDEMEKESYHVSRATVYNTVELLIQAKIVRRHVFEGMVAQYERITLPHTHLICTSCGKVKEVRDPNFAAFMNARRFNAFNADHYSLYVYGTCSTCARKSKRIRQSSDRRDKKLK